MCEKVRWINKLKLCKKGLKSVSQKKKIVPYSREINFYGAARKTESYSATASFYDCEDQNTEKLGKTEKQRKRDNFVRFLLKRNFLQTIK